MIFETKTRNAARELEPKKSNKKPLRLGLIFVAVLTVFSGLIINSANRAFADSQFSIQSTPQVLYGRTGYNLYDLRVLIDGKPADKTNAAGYAFEWFDPSNGQDYKIDGSSPTVTSDTANLLILDSLDDKQYAHVRIVLDTQTTHQIDIKVHDPKGAILPSTGAVTLATNGSKTGGSSTGNATDLRIQVVNDDSGLIHHQYLDAQLQDKSGNWNKIDPTICGCEMKWYGMDYQGNFKGGSKDSALIAHNLNHLPFDVSNQNTYTAQIELDYQENLAGSPLKTVTLNTKTPQLENPSGVNPVQATLDPLLSAVTKIVQILVFAVTAFLYGIFRTLLTPVIQVVLSLNPHQADFAAVILTAWVFVRNVVNILFIVALVALGIATLLRVDEEHLNYKHLIPELVMMALLVNFSLVIAQLILGVADTIQAQFLPNNADVINSLAKQLILLPNANTYTTVFQNSGSFAQIIASLVYLVFAIFAFIAFGLVAAYLVIRIVALWLLLMLSPVAYAAQVLPWTHEFASEWWSNFIKYSFFTPAVAFFLHVCAVIAVAQSSYMSTLTATIIHQNQNQGAAQFVYSSLSSFLLIICIMAGLQISHMFGIKAAESLTHGVEHKVGHWAHEGLHWAQHTAGAAALRWKNEKITNPLMDKYMRDNSTKGKLMTRLAKMTAPGQALKARRERIHHDQERIGKETAGLMATGSKLTASHGKIDLRRDIEARRANLKEYADLYKGMDQELSVKNMRDLLHKGPEYNYLKQAAVMALMENGRYKDVMQQLIEEGMEEPEKDKNGNKVFKPMGDGANAGVLNGTNVTKVMDQFLGTDRDALKIRSEILSQMAKDQNQFMGIYTAAPDGKGGFINGNDKVAVSSLSPKYQQLINGNAPKDDKGNPVKITHITRHQLEEIDRAQKTEDASELVKVWFRKEFHDETHLDASFLANMEKLNLAGDKLLGLAPQQIREYLGIQGIDSASGAMIFENDAAEQRFKNAYTEEVDGVVRIKKQFENLVMMGYNKATGNTRIQDALQTGVIWMQNDGSGGYKVAQAFKSAEENTKVVRTKAAEDGVAIGDQTRTVSSEHLLDNCAPVGTIPEKGVNANTVKKGGGGDKK